MPLGNRKNILKDLFSSVLSQFKKYHAPGKLKFSYLGHSPKLKIAYFNEKNTFNYS